MSTPKRYDDVLTQPLLRALREILRREVVDPIVEAAIATIEQAAARALAAEPSSKEFLTTEEAAKLARIQPRTMRQWVQSGRIVPSGRGRSYVFRRQDVIAAMERRPKARRHRRPRREREHT